MSSLHGLLPLLMLAGVVVFVVAFAGAAICLRPRSRSSSGRKAD